jgi:hypothetical protein
MGEPEEHLIRQHPNRTDQADTQEYFDFAF